LIHNLLDLVKDFTEPQMEYLSDPLL